MTWFLRGIRAALVASCFALAAGLAPQTAWAVECSDIGAAGSTPPNDNGQSDSTACGGNANAHGEDSTAIGSNSQTAGGASALARQVGFSRWYETGEELLQDIVAACSAGEE